MSKKVLNPNDFATIETLGVDETVKVFEDLEEKAQTRILKRALVAGGMYFKNELLKTISSSGVAVNHVGYMNHAPGLWARKIPYNDTLLDAVTGKFHKGKGSDNSKFTVSMMGAHKSGSGTFRLRFFESGTRDRHQTRTSKNGKKYEFFAGRIAKHPWMETTSSSASSGVETIVEGVIETEVQKYQEKLDKIK